jgi:hypothetical protein
VARVRLARSLAARAGHEYNVREKTYAERLFGMPPDMSFARESLFLYDSTNGWTAALLYGKEYDLAIFEVSARAAVGRRHAAQRSHALAAWRAGWRAAAREAPRAACCPARTCARRRLSRPLRPCPPALLHRCVWCDVRAHACAQVLVYTVCDMSLRNSVLSAIITYAAWLVIEFWRSSLGSANIAKKTLIDDRFLI